MPRTPVEVREVNSRTSSPEKRMALPIFVAKSTSSPASSKATPISLSLLASSNFIANLPFDGMLVKASMLFRRTLPIAVANTTLSAPQLSSSSGSGKTVRIVSPSSRDGSILTMGLPRVVGPPSGSFQTFKRYTLPCVEKNSTGLCVDVTNISRTASSSFVAIPARPLPPRFCARKVERGVRLI